MKRSTIQLVLTGGIFVGTWSNFFYQLGTIKYNGSNIDFKGMEPFECIF